MRKTPFHPNGTLRRPNFHPNASHHHPNFHPNYHRYSPSRAVHDSYNRRPVHHPNHRPPERDYSTRLPNFIVELRSDRRPFRRDQIDSLIAQCTSAPESFNVNDRPGVVATLNFRQWVEARDAVVWFWESRLAENHNFTPELISHVLVPSDMDELEGLLRERFTAHVRGLKEEGKEVKRWVEEIEKLQKEIAQVANLLRKPRVTGLLNMQWEKKRRLESEKKLVEGRIREFGYAMECVLKYLEGDGNVVEDGVPVFKFDGGFDCKRIHSMIMRERRRLEEGLPIYAHRREILQGIFRQQVSIDL